MNLPLVRRLRSVKDVFNQLPQLRNLHGVSRSLLGQYFLKNKISSKHHPSVSYSFDASPMPPTAKWNRDFETIPLFYRHVLECFEPLEEKVILDATFGNGGHSVLLLEASPTCKVVALDRDPNAVSLAKELSKTRFLDRLIPIQGTFSQLPNILRHLGHTKFDGIVFDTGASELQLSDPYRGFSASSKGSFDLRMDPNDQVPTASEVLQNIEENHLHRLLRTYGKLKQARQVTTSLIEARYMFHKFQTAKEVREIIKTTAEAITRRSTRSDSETNELAKHMFNRTMTALRMFVNDELNELDFGLRMANCLLKDKGRLLVISKNEMEEQIVKAVLTEVQLPRDRSYSDSDITHLFEFQPWELLHSGLALPEAEQTLRPNVGAEVKLYGATKKHEPLRS